MVFAITMLVVEGNVRKLIRFCVMFICSAPTAAISLSSIAQTTSTMIGAIVMHGKGGSLNRLVSDLTIGLEQKSILVANLEMPWSARRDYDVDVISAELQISTAIDELRSKGAKKIFVIGHSMGGVFAQHYASKHAVDGVILIAPGGSVASMVFRKQLGASVASARKLVAQGKGGERSAFLDYEGSRGTSTIQTTATIYLTWFNPDGAMNAELSAKNLNPRMPVLYIAPRNDYPNLQRIKQAAFSALPANPLTRLYEPDADHRGAPGASVGEILRWTAEVAAR